MGKAHFGYVCKIVILGGFIPLNANALRVYTSNKCYFNTQNPKKLVTSIMSKVNFF